MVLKNSFILLMVVLFMVFVLLAVVDVHHDNRIMNNLFIEYIIRAGHGLVCFSLYLISSGGTNNAFSISSFISSYSSPCSAPLASITLQT